MMMSAPRGVNVFVNFDDVAGSPEMHQAVDLVDQRSGSAIATIAHALADAFVPWAQPDFAAGTIFSLVGAVGCGSPLHVVLRFRLTTGALENLITIVQTIVRVFGS
jgi:hypothetical protein